MILFIHNYTQMLSAFPCGRTQHVRPMCSSIVSVIQSVLEFRFMCAILYKLFCVCQALKKETNGSPQPLLYFLPYEREPEVHKCIHPKHFQVSGIKISNVVTKETSQILLQTLWHLRKLQILVVSL